MKKLALLLAVIAAMFVIAFMAWWLWPPGPLGSPGKPAPSPTTSTNPMTTAPTSDETPAPKPPTVSTPVVSESSNERAHLSSEQFAALTERTLHELPTALDLRNLSEEEAHDYPEPLARAGVPLGRIAQAVHDQPSLKPQATRFYSDCAKSETIVVPIRALCYSHVLGDPQAPSPESLPSEVVRLARLIPAESF